MLDDVSVEQANKMIEYLNGALDEHRKTCEICYIDHTDRTCIFCRQTTRMLCIQGLYMERIREHESRAVRAHD